MPAPRPSTGGQRVSQPVRQTNPTGHVRDPDVYHNNQCGTYPNPDGHRHGNSNCNSYSYSDGYRNRDSDCQCYRDGDSDSGRAAELEYLDTSQSRHRR